MDDVTDDSFIRRLRVDASLSSKILNLNLLLFVPEDRAVLIYYIVKYKNKGSHCSAECLDVVIMVFFLIVVETVGFVSKFEEFFSEVLVLNELRETVTTFKIALVLFF